MWYCRLLKDKMFGPHEEQRRALFGPTWITGLDPYLKLCTSISDSMKTQRQSGHNNSSNTRKKRKNQHGDTSTSTVTSGYVTYNHSVSPHPGQNGIFSRVNQTLAELSLPQVELPIDFINLRDVAHIGGRVTHFYENWKIMTKNEEILEIARGGKIDLTSIPNVTRREVKSNHTSAEKLAIQKLLDNKVIEVASSGGHSSHIFFKRKSSGELRAIINLSKVNVHVEYKHFKMSSIYNAVDICRPDDEFGIVDLGTAYDSVGVAKEHRRFLQFSSGGVTYQYRAFPNGLSEAPRKFTLLLKPICSFLNFLGIRFVSYIDDMLVLARNAVTVKLHLSIICQTFVLLGFVINFKKTISKPSRKITFLGYVLDSINQTVSLPTEKIIRVEEMCMVILTQGNCTKRVLASVVGTLHSCAIAVCPAPLYYRNLQFQLNKDIGDDWEKIIYLNQGSLEDLTWWTTNIPKWNGAPWRRPAPTMTIKTDASMEGWGAVLSPGAEAQGYWSIPEKTLHINILEIMAVKLGLYALANTVAGTHLMIRSDNTTALAYIRKMGGTKNIHCSKIAIEIWKWALARGVYLYTQHIPGHLNVTADRLSRQVDHTDFQLDRNIFLKIQNLWGPIKLDMFARKWNAQVHAFFAWKGHPEAAGIDAMSQNWPQTGAYAFPPFILIPQILKKIHLQEIESIVLIAPMWKGQVWYSTIIKMCIDFPRKLPQAQLILRNRKGEPYKQKHHLAAWRLSGKDCKMREFQTKLLASCPRSRRNQQLQRMNPHGEFGIAGIKEGIPMPFKPLFQ